MNKDILQDLYLNKRFSQREIAKKMKCSQTNVRYYLKKYSIKRNKRNNVTDVSLKLCPCCSTIKTRTEFYKANKEGKRVNGSWCKACMTEQTAKRQRRYKDMYVKQKGGCCQSCGFNKYNGALEFHHIDPSQKDSKMSKMTRRPDNPEVQRELAKCVLVCSNCHRMIHAGIIDCPQLS